MGTRDPSLLVAAHLFEFSDPTSFKVIIGREWDRATTYCDAAKKSGKFPRSETAGTSTTLKIKGRGYYNYLPDISYHISN